MTKKSFSSVRIQTKRDTAANWEKNNPVLLNGEKIIVDTAAGEIREKIGDGTKKYSALPFTDEPLRTLIGNKVDKASGKGLSTNDYTTDEKNKLAGIATGANKYTHPTYTKHDAGLYKVTVDGSGHVSAATAVTKSDITGLGIPASNTTYSIATTDIDGLMSSTDKTKLDGIDEGANKYTHPSSHGAGMITQDATHRFVSDAEKSTWNAKASTSTATTSANGLMSSTDKTKLDGIVTGANKYTHPTYTSVTNGLYKVTVDGSGHVSSAIAVSKADITGLGIPASNTTYSVATTDNNGLMSSDDKTKLDGIDEGANKYTHPSSHGASMITQDATHRFVSDAEKSTWNAKASTSVATTTASGLMSSDDKSKLDGIATGANKYSHPTYTSRTAGLYKVTVDSSGHVSAATAVGKADITGLGIPGSDTTYSVATTDTDGLMGSKDKTKLDGIDEGANKYTHPSSHAASMITQDATHRFVSDAQVSTWNAKASTSVATTTANGLMSSDDKSKLDGIATGANKYTHPTYTSRTAGLYKVTVDGSGHVSAVAAVTKADITGLGIPASNTTYSVASATADGLMSSDDKSKLDGIDDGANKYTHPSSHAASMITTDATHRFVSDTQISTWNAKASTSVATTSANGLMSSDDKTKLDGIATGANKYSHPTYTSRAAGLYKVTVDGSGHVSAATAVAKADITSLGIPGSDTNTTYDLAASASSANGNVKLNLTAGGSGSGTDTISIKGSGATTVTTDADGAITISSTDNNTTYSLATTTANGLMAAADKVAVNKISGLETRIANIEEKLKTAVFYK